MRCATIKIMAIAIALITVAMSQASAYTVVSDSGGTVWRRGVVYDYFISPSATSCNLAYDSWTPPPPHGDSIGEGYRIYNLYGKSASICTLRFNATRVSGGNSCQIWITCPGKALSRRPSERWTDVQTGPLLASPTLSTLVSKYSCAFNAANLPFGNDFVFLSFLPADKNSEWQITNDTLVCN